MRKRRIYLVLLILAVAGVVGVIVVGAFREREPEYGGKSLSEWVKVLPTDANPFGQTEAEVALRSMGTNAVPYLFKWIDYEPAAWKLKLYELLGRHLNRGTNELFQDRRMLLACGAARAIGAFGKASGEVETILRAMLTETNHEFRNMYVGYALAVSHGPFRSLPSLRRPESVGFPHGVDTLRLSVQTNGAPLLMICHTSSIAPSIRSAYGGDLLTRPSKLGAK